VKRERVYVKGYNGAHRSSAEKVPVRRRRVKEKTGGVSRPKSEHVLREVPRRQRKKPSEKLRGEDGIRTSTGERCVGDPTGTGTNQRPGEKMCTQIKKDRWVIGEEGGKEKRRRSECLDEKRGVKLNKPRVTGRSNADSTAQLVKLFVERTKWHGPERRLYPRGVRLPHRVKLGGG